MKDRSIQEEIREGINMRAPIPQAINKQLLWLLGDYQKYQKTDSRDPNFICLDEYLARTIVGILLDLRDKGCVLKVDRELPDLLEKQRERLKEVPEHGDLRNKFQDWLISDCLKIIRVTKRTQQAMLKAGYVAIEPLIEE